MILLSSAYLITHYVHINLVMWVFLLSLLRPAIVPAITALQRSLYLLGVITITLYCILLLYRLSLHYKGHSTYYRSNNYYSLLYPAVVSAITALQRSLYLLGVITITLYCILLLERHWSGEYTLYIFALLLVLTGIINLLRDILALTFQSNLKLCSYQ